MTKMNTYLLNDMRSLSVSGPGYIEPCAQRLCNGSLTVKLTAPNALSVPSEGCKAYTTLTLRLAPQNLTAYGQLFLHVYPDCPGLQCVTLEIALCSDGRMSAFHQAHLTNGVWNDAALDLSGVPRESVTQIVICRRPTGRQQNMSASCAFYFGELRLEEAASSPCASSLGAELPWREITESALSCFHAHRCGPEVPGVHLPCHSDCFAVHPDGRRVFLSGGWHDLGNLSHSLEHTALAAQSLMSLFEALPEKETALRDRLLEEARYGLEWMQFTRFADGYRCVQADIPAWTDEVIGTADDVLCDAHNDPYANFCAAAVSARASVVYRDEDAVFALYCLNCAREDFRFAYEHMHLHEMIYGIRELQSELSMHAQALCAAVALYQADGDESYLEHALRFADVVCSCLDKKIGVFCEDGRQLKPDSQPSAVLALRGLALLACQVPEHPQSALWRETLSVCARHLASCAPAASKGMVAERFFEELMLHACGLSSAASALRSSALADAAEADIRWLLGENPFGVSFMNGVCGGNLPVWDAFCSKHIGALRTGLRILPDGRLSLSVDEDCCHSELTPLSCLLLTLAQRMRPGQ